MDKFQEYEALLDEDNMTAVRDRRESIARAMDALLSQMEEFHAERKKLDEKDQHLLALARKLDEAHARISRGVRYTAKSGKRLVRRFWQDDTHEWVEQYLLQWVRKLLQEGEKTVGTMQWNQPGRFALADAVSLMEQHPEEFAYAKSLKPRMKYARAEYVWSLKGNPPAHLPPAPPPYWNVEAAFTSREQPRQRSLSESLHEMLEQSIQMFYAKQSSSIFVAFADLYYREFANSYHAIKAGYDRLKMESNMNWEKVAEQAARAAQEDRASKAKNEEESKQAE